MKRQPRRLACGCTTEGFLCDEHRARALNWADPIAQAADPLALVALAMFCGMVVMWAAILPDVFGG